MSQHCEQIVQDPKRASELKKLHDMFSRNYDLTSDRDKQAFFEGLKELGRHAINTCSSANLSFVVGGNGLVSVQAQTVPNPV